VIGALLVLGVLIGLTLGAFGAGGSVLAVPVLVNVAGLSASAATATSLVAVGGAAGVAAIGHRHRVRLDVASWFVPTGIVGAMVGAMIGERLSHTATLLGFSTLMLIAAAHLLTQPTPRSLSAAAHVPTSWSQKVHGVDCPRRNVRNGFAVGLAGLSVGALTGLFGVGGGFVIVPALTLAVGLAMPEAVATSLVIVTANALIALTVRGPDSVDWSIATALTVPMLLGSFAGQRLARRLDPHAARRAFAGLLVVVAVANAAAI
jgi:uncharacterized membrane protein YfcA